MSKLAAIVFFVLAFLAGGFFLLQNQQDKTIQTSSDSVVRQNSKSSSTKVEGYYGNVLAGQQSPLFDFNKKDYDKAIASRKIILLYFYANWCPVCRVEVSNALYPAFNELTTNKIVGFRINYNDSDTNEDERLLALQFGIAYQHSKVVLKDRKEVLKSLDQWDKEQYLSELGQILTQ